LHALKLRLFERPQVSPWLTTLDFIGIDCYQELPLPPHPALPWQQLPQSDLVTAWGSLLPGYANLSAASGGLHIVCTEVGWPSRPWVSHFVQISTSSRRHVEFPLYRHTLQEQAL
jgi:hypothetical protein